MVLLRHGQSLWNLENRFTGWVDVDLSSKGYQEAKQAAKSLIDNGYVFDIAFCSVLRRSIRTLWIVLEQMDLMWLPVESDWRLNERHYGSLQGLNKDDIRKQYGEEQVLQWRRSYDISPPPLDASEHKSIASQSQYAQLDHSDIPLSESLHDTINRVVPYWESHIQKHFIHQERVIVVAHGNTIRALIKHFLNLTKSEVLQLNIPTATPVIIKFDDQCVAKEYQFLDTNSVG